MIYDEPNEVIRRYGKTGYRVIAENGCLRDFFSSGGDWTMYDAESCGGNCISWETRYGIVYLEHDYTGSKAKIKQETLEILLKNLAAWKASGK